MDQINIHVPIFTDNLFRRKEIYHPETFNSIDTTEIINDANQELYNANVQQQVKIKKQNKQQMIDPKFIDP